jgi:hypothetical protein
MRNTKVNESSRDGGGFRYDDWVKENISSGNERENAITGFRVLSVFRIIRKYEELGELLGLL